jgi:hypothetical protein
LVESLALHELIDQRIKDTYDTYALYHLARAAYLCVRTNPEQRPSMGEVSLEKRIYIFLVIYQIMSDLSFKLYDHEFIFCWKAGCPSY